MTASAKPPSSQPIRRKLALSAIVPPQAARYSLRSAASLRDGAVDVFDPPVELPDLRVAVLAGAAGGNDRAGAHGFEELRLMGGAGRFGGGGLGARVPRRCASAASAASSRLQLGVSTISARARPGRSASPGPSGARRIGRMGRRQEDGMVASPVLPS